MVVAQRVSRSPWVDLVRLTRLIRRCGGSQPVSVGLAASFADAPVLAGVSGSAGLGIVPESPVRVWGVGRGVGDVASAVRSMVAAEVGVVLVSAVARSAPRSHRVAVGAALDEAAAAGVPVVAAAGVSLCEVTEHPWVVPVFSCSVVGRPSWFAEWEDEDEVPRGVLAPGEEVPGPLGAASGNGVAAAVVAGAVALLRTLEPGAPGGLVRSGVVVGAVESPYRAAPPLLDAERAWEFVRRGVC